MLRTLVCLFTFASLAGAGGCPGCIGDPVLDGDAGTDVPQDAGAHEECTKLTIGEVVFDVQKDVETARPMSW
mgnify:CR=1 FL=1